MSAVDRGRDAVPTLRCEGDVRVDGPLGTIHVVGVPDGVELRLQSLRQAWALRGVAGVLPSVEPLTAAMAGWRLSGITLYVVVAGRRIADAEPAGLSRHRSNWLPAPWRPRPWQIASALVAAALGRR